MVMMIVTSEVDVIRGGAGTHATLHSQGGRCSLLVLKMENKVTEYIETLLDCDCEGVLTSLADL